MTKMSFSGSVGGDGDRPTSTQGKGIASDGGDITGALLVVKEWQWQHSRDWLSLALLDFVISAFSFE